MGKNSNVVANDCEFGTIRKTESPKADENSKSDDGNDDDIDKIDTDANVDLNQGDSEDLLDRIKMLEKRLQNLEQTTTRKTTMNSFNNANVNTAQPEVSQSYLVDLLQNLQKELSADPSDAGSVLREIKKLSRQLNVSDSKSRDRKYPRDCYSLIALNGRHENGRWPKERFLFFLFGLMVFFFELIFLLLIVWSRVDPTLGDVTSDNPDADGTRLMSLFPWPSAFIPSGSTTLVRVSQLISFAAFALFPDLTLTDVVKAIQYFPLYKAPDDDRFPYMRFACILRGIQGFVAIIAVFLIVITSSSVVDIILNFTALNFVSGLDETAFLLARSGVFGPNLQDEVMRIEDTKLPACMYRKYKYAWFGWVMGSTFLLLVTCMVAVMVLQDSNSMWRTRVLRVQFQDGTGLNHYSGCFEINDESEFYSRNTYSSIGKSNGNASFGYCGQARRWILFIGNASDPCDGAAKELAYSVETNDFDISTVFAESWTSSGGTPLDMYFFESREKEALFCDVFLNDGICDIYLNSLWFGYDGGDCCAATCTQARCGREDWMAVFGSAAFPGDVGYPNCVDPNMVPISIYLNDIISSRDATFAVFDSSNEPWNTGEESSWRSSQPLSTSLSLECNGRNVLIVSIRASMVKKSQTVMIEDGASCILALRPVPDDIANDDPIWFVNYTVFHGSYYKNEHERVEILTQHSFENDTVAFTRLQECYFKKLANVDTLYTSSGDSNSERAIDWLLKDDMGNSECEEDSFIERYALANINFGFTERFQFLNQDPHCSWRFIDCRERQVVGLELDDIRLVGGLEGTLPSHVGLLQKLEILSLANNDLSSLPSEIGNLSSLTTLDLEPNSLSSLPSEIGNLSSLTNLDLANNDLSSLPSEIGNLSSLTTLDLRLNSLSSLPSEIGNLSSLRTLYLGNNDLSSLPSEIGNLSSLRTLYLELNFLSSLPSEIGNLSSLTSLHLYYNDLSSLPSEIGNLSSLTSLHLYYNDLSSLPSEIWNLSSLTYLALANNDLSSLSSEIENLSKYILEMLLLDGNKLVSLPSEIGQLSSLVLLSFGGNNITDVPAEVEALCSGPYTNCSPSPYPDFRT